LSDKSTVADDPIASSRWERVDDIDGEEMKPGKLKNKWEKVEGVKMGKSIKEEEREDSRDEEKEIEGKRKDRGRDERFIFFFK